MQEPKIIVDKLLCMVSNASLLDPSASFDTWEVARIALQDRQHIILDRGSKTLQQNLHFQMSCSIYDMIGARISLDEVLAELQELLRFAYPEAKLSVPI